MKKKNLQKATPYLMVAPLVAIILVIAIYPMLKSFWYSMFDYELNSPQKSEPHMNYKFNMGNYVSDIYYIQQSIDKIKGADPSNSELSNVESELQDLQNTVAQSPGMPQWYQSIKTTFDKTNITHNKQYASSGAVDKETANKIQTAAVRLNDAAKNLETNTKYKKYGLSDLSRDIEDCVLNPNFVGMSNYASILQEMALKDGSFGRAGNSLLNTIGFTVISVFFELIFGLFFALLMNKSFPGRGAFRAVVLIPWAIPTVVSSMMWKFLYDGQNGIVAMAFYKIGLISSPAVLLTTQGGAFFSVVFADIWKTTPYMALLILAGLQNIPAEIYESSRIDGANAAKSFLKITLPLLKPTIVVALLFRVLDAFRVYDLIAVLTGGGPGTATESISIYAYKLMFSQMDFGRGSALSFIVLLCVGLISLLFIKFSGADLMGTGSEA